MLADHAYQDAVTGKKIVCGIFNQFFFSKEELVQKIEEDGQEKLIVHGGMQSGSPYSYISLTDIQGKVEFQLRFVDLREDTVLMHTGFGVDCKDRLATVEVIIPLPRLPIPHAGVFALELLADNEPIGSLRIQAHEIPKEEPPSKETDI